MNTVAAAPPSTSESVHLWILLVCIGVLLASLILPADHVEQGVQLPGIHIGLPSTCIMARFTHTGCPACGLTRGFILTAHGHWGRAEAVHPLAVPLFLLCLLQLPLRGALVARPGWAAAFSRVERFGWIGVLSVVLLVWIVRLALELASRLA